VKYDAYVALQFILSNFFIFIFARGIPAYNKIRHLMMMKKI